MRARQSLALGSAIAAGITGASAAPSLAAPPVVTVNGLDPGPGITGSTYTFSGSFRSAAAIRTSASCCAGCRRLRRQCTDYLTSTGGTYGSAWSALGATIATNDLRSGTYRLPVSGLRNGNYLLAAYARTPPRTRVPAPICGSRLKSPPSLSSASSRFCGAESMWQPAADPNCTDTAGSRTLGQNAVDLRSRGLFGVGGVVVNRT